MPDLTDPPTARRRPAPEPNLRAPLVLPEYEPVLDELARLGLPPTVTPDMILGLRRHPLPAPVPLADLLAPRGLIATEQQIPGPAGAPNVTVAIVTRADRRPGGPGFLHLHGGGMVLGDRYSGIEPILDWVQRFNAVAVSVEYRLAPEHPDPAPVEDCYAGLLWMAAHAEELGFDPARLVVAGASAGGGLAAGVALLTRDRSGPPLAGQVLMYPMLDDRNATVSARQVDGIGVWDRRSSDTGWNALLGTRRGTSQVSIYATPGRATDLAGVAPAFIDVGTVDVFRDEDVAYASRIWAGGGDAELHVWPGGFHAFDLFAPQSPLAHAMSDTRINWLRRRFARHGDTAVASPGSDRAQLCAADRPSRTDRMKTDVIAGISAAQCQGTSVSVSADWRP